MKKNLKKLLLIICMLLTNSAYAYKFVIYTDQPESINIKDDMATKVGEELKTTYPFSTFDIEFEVVRVRPSELDCGDGVNANKAVDCKNLDDIQKKALKRGGDQAMVLKDSPFFGGGTVIGGGVPTMTTRGAPKAMLHEYLHTLGLCDEYEYSAEQAKAFCGSNNTPNQAMIEPLNPYGSDGMARGKHSGAILWFNDILPTTPITNTDGTILGTGDVDYKKRAASNNTTSVTALGEPTGLYKGKVCKNASPSKTTWHPSSGSTIMDNYTNGLGAPLEKIVERLLISKGMKKKLQFEDEELVNSVKKEEPAGSVTVTPEPFERINNSARSFFKSFFGWTKDLFENVKKVFNR